MNVVENLHQENFNIQMKFLLTCLGCVKQLYHQFSIEVGHDSSVYSAKFKSGEAKINNLYDEMFGVLFSDPDKKLNSQAEDFYELAPSYEEYATVDATIAVQIALLCASIIEFYHDKSFESISEVLINMEEIIHILKSQEYDEQDLTSPGAKIDRDDYINSAISREEEQEQNIINFLRANETLKAFQNIVEKNIIR
ncbi:hypothetical protein ACUN24_05620 [Pedobacter sp. WC2501]|uniref:hypothetical protein n=1 Tax=Pedobacter sp. WC2501 TaxID=3461400 RepID=UPI004045B060